MDGAEDKGTQVDEALEREGVTDEPLEPEPPLTDTPLFTPAVLVGLLWQRGITVPTREGPHGLRRVALALRELSTLRQQQGEAAQLELLDVLTEAALEEARELREDAYTCLGMILAERLRGAKEPGADRVRLTLLLSAEQHQRWATLAQQRGTDLPMLIRRLLDTQVEERPP